MTTAISIRNLTKQYGKLTVLDNLTLDVPHGSIFGFLGPNGAGKSTTIRILAGLSRATSGSASVNGVPVTAAGLHRRHLGYIAQEPKFYGWMTGREVLEYAASYHFKNGVSKHRIDSLLERVGIAQAGNRACRTYSGGMRQRLGIAQALIGKPAVVILDEPVSAMDPIGRAEVLDLMRDLRGETTVFYSTHILEDVQRLSDYVAILDRGTLITTAPTRELLSSFNRGTLRVTFANSDAQMMTALKKIPGVIDCSLTEHYENIVVYAVQAEEDAVPQVQLALTHFASDRQIALITNDLLKIDLETVFLQLLGAKASKHHSPPVELSSSNQATLSIDDPTPSEEGQPKRRSRKGAAFVLASSLVVGGGSLYAYAQTNRSSNSSIAVSLLPAVQGNVENSVTETGTIELGGQQVLRAPSEVTVEQVNVKEGQRVRKGQALVVLRNRQVQEQIKDQIAENEKAELDLSRTRAKVADAARKLQEAKDDPDLARSQEKVAEVQTQVQTAETRFKESQALLQKGFISATELQTDKTSLDTAKSSLRDTQIAALKARRDHQNKVVAAQSEFDDAQVALDKAEIDIQKGREKLQGLQRQLGDRIVTAPIDGVVLKVNVRNGDGIKTESPILAIGDPNQETIRIQLTTLNAAKVQVNQPARVSLIGPQMQQFTGKVISLSPQATVPGAQPGDAASVQPGQQAKVEARIALDKPSNTLIPGSSVSVEIITEQRQNVISVAPEAIQRTEEPPFVWMKDQNNRAKKQPVQIGLQGLQGIEVTEGLKAGDEVVIPQPNTQIQVGSLLNPDPQPIPSPSP